MNNVHFKKRRIPQLTTFLFRKSFIIFCSLFVSGIAAAATRSGVSFDEIVPSQNLVGKELVLNGLGTRTKFFMKVYIAGLYLNEKTNDAEKALNSDTEKMLKIHFMRGVSADKITTAWNEGFENNCIAQCEGGKPLVAKLNALMRDMKQNETLTFLISSNAVAVNVNGTPSGSVEGPQFGKNILAIFLGKKPPNAELKEGLLGLNQTND